MPAIRQEGVLRVLVVNPDSPIGREFLWLEGEHAGGLEGEILEAFARDQGLRLAWERVRSWEALLPAFQRGSADLMAGAVTVTPARERVARFTSETFPTRHVVVNRAPQPPIESLEALRQQTVGSVRGTSYVAAVAAAGVPAARIRDGFVVRELLPALAAGTISAYVVGLETAVLDRRRDPALQIGLCLGARGRFAFGVRPDAPRLHAALDAHLTELRRTPAWNRLVVRYFGASALEILERAGRE